MKYDAQNCPEAEWRARVAPRIKITGCLSGAGRRRICCALSFPEASARSLLQPRPRWRHGRWPYREKTPRAPNVHTQLGRKTKPSCRELTNEAPDYFPRRPAIRHDASDLSFCPSYAGSKSETPSNHNSPNINSVSPYVRKYIALLPIGDFCALMY